MTYNPFYTFTDSDKAIRRIERVVDDNKPAEPSKPSGSVLTMEVLDLIKQGKVREANAIINASKGVK